jgi:hypothetical protein
VPISTDPAPFPLLWIIPLLLYLATFIIAFGSESATRTTITANLVWFGAVLLSAAACLEWRDETRARRFGCCPARLEHGCCPISLVDDCNGSLLFVSHGPAGTTLALVVLLAIPASRLLNNDVILQDRSFFGGLQDRRRI